MLVAGASGEELGGAPREEQRAVPAHSVLGPCRELGVVVDTCVTRALVIHRDGMRSPKGEIRQRWG